MKMSEVKALSSDELIEKANILKQQLFALRFRAKVGKLEKSSDIKHIKHDIARIFTELNFRDENIDFGFHKIRKQLTEQLKAEKIAKSKTTKNIKSKDITENNISEITPENISQKELDKTKVQKSKIEKPSNKTPKSVKKTTKKVSQKNEKNIKAGGK